MKFCISASGPAPESAFNPRFGRCNYFILLDSVSGKFEAIANENSNADGAGVKAAALAGGKKPDCVLSGNIGPNAFTALEAAGIEVYLGMALTVSQAVEHYNQGLFKKAEAPSAKGHHGLRTAAE